MKAIKHPHTNLIYGGRIVLADSIFFVPDDSVDHYVKIGCILVGVAPPVVQEVQPTEISAEVEPSAVLKRRGRRYGVRNEV